MLNVLKNFINSFNFKRKESNIEIEEDYINYLKDNQKEFKEMGFDIYIDENNGSSAIIFPQYYILTKEFEESGYEVVMETEKSGGKKSPILASLENLRKDIGTYSDRLMLNAKANKDSEINLKTNDNDPFNKLFDGLKSG